MKRRDFIEKGITAGAFMGSSACGAYHANVNSPASFHPDKGEVTIEREKSGKPHQGKVLAAIQPHNDDIPLFAGGTVAKLLREGYTGYLIRTSNDDAAGRGSSLGERVLNNEKDNYEVAKVYGMKKVYDLYYRNHRMDQLNMQEIKGRLIFLFRMLKVDTIVSYDPWGHYEENPDHYVTAKAVEAARWMAGMNTDYPEHLDAGITPHGISESYYFARGPQFYNHVVETTKALDKKIEANVANKSQGPAGDYGARLRQRLADEGKSLPILGNSDQEANFNYVKHFVLDRDSERLRGVPSDKAIGEEYGLEWAERFRYVGPTPSKLDEYIKNNAE